MNKTYLTIIFTIVFSLLSFAQIATEFNGEMYKIKGMITSKSSKDILQRVIVEFRNKDNKLIKATQSDFDGAYSVSFCSKELIGDSLFIKTTKEFYKQETFKYKIASDTIINIQMNYDEDRKLSKEKFIAYNRRMLYGEECGLVEDEYDEFQYKRNLKTYKHYCTGEVKKYKNLVDGNENFSDWILIEKE